MTTGIGMITTVQRKRADVHAACRQALSMPCDEQTIALINCHDHRLFYHSYFGCYFISIIAGAACTSTMIMPCGVQAPAAQQQEAAQAQLQQAMRGQQKSHWCCCSFTRCSLCLGNCHAVYAVWCAGPSSTATGSNPGAAAAGSALSAEEMQAAMRSVEDETDAAAAAALEQENAAELAEFTMEPAARVCACNFGPHLQTIKAC